MKYFNILIVLIFSFSNVIAQTQRVQFLEKAVLDITERRLLDANSKEVYLHEIDGSPYLNEKFFSGLVYNDNDKQYYGFRLRYNIFNDEIEIHNPDDDSVSALLKNPAYSCTINNQYFKYLQLKDEKDQNMDGYFIELTKEDTKLLMKYNCSYFAGEPSLNSIIASKPAAFTTEKVYYILKDETLQQLPKSKKKIIQLFGKFENEARDYIRDKKLHIKNERDLVRIISYYNSLLKEQL